MRLTGELVRKDYKTTCSGKKPVCAGCSTVKRKKRGGREQSFSLKGAPAPHVLLEVDSMKALDLLISREQKRCDYLFVADRPRGKGGYVVAIEMSSCKKAKDLASQLQGGADIAVNLGLAGSQVKFVPLYIGKIRAVEVNRLTKANLRVTFPGSNGLGIQSPGGLVNIARLLKRLA